MNVYVCIFMYYVLYGIVKDWNVKYIVRFFFFYIILIYIDIISKFEFCKDMKYMLNV